MDKPTKETIEQLEKDHGYIHVSSSSVEGQWHVVCRRPTRQEAKRHFQICAQDASEGNFSLIQRIAVWPAGPALARILEKYSLFPDGIMVRDSFKRFIGQSVKEGFTDPSPDLLALWSSKADDHDDLLAISSPVEGQWNLILRRPKRTEAKAYKMALNSKEPEANLTLLKRIAVYPDKDGMELFLDQFPFAPTGITSSDLFQRFIGLDAEAGEK